MSKLRCIFILGSMLLANICGAQVHNTNPNVILSFVGNDTFTVTTPGASIPGFSVKLTDAAGVPIPGIALDFFTNAAVCIGEDPNCSFPAETLYGRFPIFGSNVAVTDANGIATSGPYLAGTTSGTYSVAVDVSFSSGAANYAILKDGANPSADFDIVQDFPASVAGIALDGYLSGNWYDPAQSGQGFQLEFTNQDNTVVAIWFTFAPDGSGQNWIYAQGTYDLSKSSVVLDAVIDTGAKFPPLFVNSDIHETPWGTLTFTFADCNHGVASWNSTLPGYGSGSMPIFRLTQIRGTTCPQ